MCLLRWLDRNLDGFSLWFEDWLDKRRWERQYGRNPKIPGYDD